MWDMWNILCLIWAKSSEPCWCLCCSALIRWIFAAVQRFLSVFASRRFSRLWLAGGCVEWLRSRTHPDRPPADPVGWREHIWISWTGSDAETDLFSGSAESQSNAFHQTPPLSVHQSLQSNRCSLQPGIRPVFEIQVAATEWNFGWSDSAF